MTRRMFLEMAGLAGPLAAGFAAVQHESTLEAAPAAQGGRAAQAPAAAGTVTGKITFSGTAPKPRPVRMSSDPLCMKEGAGVTSEVLLVGPATVSRTRSST